MTPTYPRSPRGINTPGTLNEARWRVTKHQVIIVRVVEYQTTNRETTGETYRLITTITDWEDALAPTWAAPPTITAGIRDRPRRDRNSPDLVFPGTALDVPS
jgi:hypothetical protein